MGKSIDDLLEDVGPFGRFQVTRLTMLYITIFPAAFHNIIMVWVASEPPWECVANSTACSLNGTYMVGDPDYNLRCNLNRSDWEYAQYEGPRTSIVSEFDLVCDKSVHGWLATSIQFIGMTVVTIPFGMISDRYGRLVTLYPCAAILAVVGLASAFATKYWQFLLSRVVIGGCIGGLFIPVITLTSEFVGPRHRPLSEIMTWNFWAVGFITADVIAYFVRDWRTLMILFSVPWILILVFFKFIPESMRWHATHNKVEKAEKTLREIAQVNKKTYPNEPLSTPQPDPKSKRYLTLFSTCWLTSAVFIQSFAWFVNSVVYYGASYGAADFGGNMYLNFFLTSLVEIPANFILIYACKRFGRKKSVIIPMILGGVACVIVALIPAGTNRTDYIAGRVAGGIFGKGAIVVSFGGVFVWASELFPTIVRGSALSTFQASTNFGGICAPFILQADRVHTVLPFALMGGLAIISALSCLLLPETKNNPTPEIFEDTKSEGMLMLLHARIDDNKADNKEMKNDPV